MNAARMHSISRLAALAAMVAAAIGAQAADYHWTGAAGDHLWSTAGNWESAGGAAVAAPTPGTAYTYNFGTRNGTNVGWGGDLVVTQDMAVVIGSALALNPATTDGESVAFVTADGGSMKFNDECSIYVQNNSRLTLNVDLSGDNKNSRLTKFGTGTLVFALKKPNAQRRFVNIINGHVEIAEDDAGANIAIQMSFSENEVATSTFSNYRNGGIHGLYVGALGDSKANGRAYLNGTTLNVGGETGSTSTNKLPGPVFANGGTLAYGNGRRALLRGLPIGGTLAVDRADVRVDAAGTAIRWLFDDEDNPMRDDVGAGARLLAPNGVPDVVTDPVRGKVLSISGGKYFMGPDANANAGFAELQQQTTNNAYTVAFWFKPASDCDPAGKIFFWGQNSAGRAAGLRLNNSTTQPLMFTVWNNNRILKTGNVRDGKWHHFAVTYNGNKTFSIYVDNALVDSFTQDLYFPPNKNFYIGRVFGVDSWEGTGANPYTGLLDDFLIGTYEMRAEDIDSLYRNGLKATVGVGSVEARSAGEVAIAKDGVSAKTLAGGALAGGVTMLEEGATLAVGVEAGAAATEFKGNIKGAGATLAKEGADYTLALSGSAPALSAVDVKEGVVELRRPTASPGLVAHYSFDAASEPGRESSPAGLSLAKTGSGTVASVADGVSGAALHLGGAASLSSENAIRPSSFPKGNDSYTASVWIRPTAEACAGTFPVFAWGNPAALELVMLRFNGPSSLMFSNWNADLEARNLALSDGKWHHVAVTYDGATRVKKLFFDGAEAATQTVSGGLKVGAANPLQIGHCPVPSRASQYYTGDMDEFRLVDFALSAEQVAAEFARKAPAAMAAASLVPAPVARYTFDGADPCANASGGAFPLSMQNGTVETVSGDAIVGKAAKFEAGGAYFTLPEYPESFPSGANPYTVVVRYRPDNTQPTTYAPSIVMLGDAGGWNSGKCLKFSTGNSASSGGYSYSAFRSVVSGNIPVLAGLYYASDMGTDRSRWIVATVVVAPMQNRAANSVSRVYIDGELVREYPDSLNAITPQGFAIGSNSAGAQTFNGLVDEVQVYDVALSPGQVRLVAEALEAAKGTDGSAAPVAPESVLAAAPAVTVAAGATLRVASIESVASLSGGGTVEIAEGARLEVASFDGFTGSFSGSGTLAVADGATIDFGNGATPVADFGGTVVLGSGVTVRASFADSQKHLLFSGSAIEGVENLGSWAFSGSASASLSLSHDGKSLSAGIPAAFVLVVR
ncbi:MAG: LamG domain-containing protein [Kiritimatiellae bacterium]|nr:LamG domain-containing protein [Kiritimatiellia bacterium]